MSSSANSDFPAGLTYKVIRSRRRSISVKICDDNTIVLRCPVGTPDKKIEGFLFEKRNWLRRHIEQNIALTETFADVIANKKILVGGQFYDLEICNTNAAGGGVIRVRSLSALKKVYISTFGEQFLQRFKLFAQANGFNYNSVSFRAYKGRWGCCDARDNIVFNYKLLMLPLKLQDFVIAHELCHTVHRNHSAQFHRLLDRVYPSNRNDEKELKRYALIARRYS